MWTFGDRCGACGASATLLSWYYGSQCKEGCAYPLCETCAHNTLAAIVRDEDFLYRGRGCYIALFPSEGARSATDSPEWPPYTAAFEAWKARQPTPSQPVLP
jgi:hypothetical protein